MLRRSVCLLLAVVLFVGLPGGRAAAEPESEREVPPPLIRKVGKGAGPPPLKRPVPRPAPAQKEVLLDSAFPPGLFDEIFALINPSVILVVGLMEASIPAFVQMFSERLSRYLDVAGEREISRRFTLEDFRRHVVARIPKEYAGLLKGMVIRIQPDGFVGLGTLRVNEQEMNFRTRVGVVLDGGRPHAVLHEVIIGPTELPDDSRADLEEMINQSIDRQRRLLRIKEFLFESGAVYLRAELV